jgi:uncharacterized protein
VSNENFARGVALFNDGHFFEAHEVLEDVWRAAPANEKRFLQGIVQLAVAFHHHSTGNSVGMRSVMERGMRNISGNDHVHEVNVDALVTSLAAWREALDNGGPLPELPRIETSSSVKKLCPSL